jgi:hypothetical protein
MLTHRATQTGPTARLVIGEQCAPMIPTPAALQSNDVYRFITLRVPRAVSVVRAVPQAGTVTASGRNTNGLKEKQPDVRCINAFPTKPFRTIFFRQRANGLQGEYQAQEINPIYDAGAFIPINGMCRWHIGPKKP